jgi:hypothetical protein
MKRALLITMLLVATSCGSVVADHAVTGRSGAPHAGPVQIVMDTAPVPGGFTEIALVRARGNGNRANLESVIEGLKTEARLVGANAVVRVRIDQGSGNVSAIGTAGIVP